MSKHIELGRSAALPAADPCVIVIFGASGDLTRRKLLPALFTLACEGCLVEAFRMIGVARDPWNAERFRSHIRAGVLESAEVRAFDPREWEKFAAHIDYLPGDISDPNTYRRLATLLDGIPGTAGTNRLFYFATAPSSAPVIVDGLAQARLNRQERGWSRILVEKPFGRDLASASVLNAALAGVFGERQVYRIDHYLGKETVQNIVFLFWKCSVRAAVEPQSHRPCTDHRRGDGGCRAPGGLLRRVRGAA